jgi:hypothetical protein
LGSEHVPDEQIDRLNSNSNHDGRISYLAKRFGGHVIYSNIISITVNNVGYPDERPLLAVADFDDETHFHTENDPNSWLCYDFKSNCVISFALLNIRTLKR